MGPLHINIEEETIHNEFYRRVVYTDEKMQVVLMSISPGGNIPEEVHPHTTQFIRVESGRGIILVDDNPYEVYDGIVVVIPYGSKHFVYNPSNDTPLKLYTVYSKPEHPQGLVEVNQPM